MRKERTDAAKRLENMDTKILIVALVVIIGFTTCGLVGNGQCNTNRSFVIDWSVGGVIDTIKVGDTIKLNFEYMNQLYDKNGQEFVDVTHWHVNPFVQVLGVKNDTFLGRHPSFDYYSTTGGLLANAITDSIWTLVIGVEPVGNLKRFTGGMVALESGKFHVSLGSFTLRLVLEECPGRLVWLDYDLVDEQGDSLYNNYHMLESEALREEYTEEEMEQFAGFVFVVEP